MCEYCYSLISILDIPNLLVRPSDSVYNSTIIIAVIAILIQTFLYTLSAKPVRMTTCL